jgi:hypothetical protein
MYPLCIRFLVRAVRRYPFLAFPFSIFPSIPVHFCVPVHTLPGRYNTSFHIFPQLFTQIIFWLQSTWLKFWVNIFLTSVDLTQILSEHIFVWFDLSQIFDWKEIYLTWVKSSEESSVEWHSSEGWNHQI